MLKEENIMSKSFMTAGTEISSIIEEMNAEHEKKLNKIGNILYQVIDDKNAKSDNKNMSQNIRAMLSKLPQEDQITVLIKVIDNVCKASNNQKYGNGGQKKSKGNKDSDRDYDDEDFGSKYMGGFFNH